MTLTNRLLVTALVAGGVGFLIGGAAGWERVFSASVASWVQAIGGLGAVIATSIIAVSESRRAERERQEATHASRSAALALEDAALTLLVNASEIITRAAALFHPAGAATLNDLNKVLGQTVAADEAIHVLLQRELSATLILSGVGMRRHLKSTLRVLKLAVCDAEEELLENAAFNGQLGDEESGANAILRALPLRGGEA